MCLNPMPAHGIIGLTKPGRYVYVDVRMGVWVRRCRLRRGPWRGCIAGTPLVVLAGCLYDPFAHRVRCLCKDPEEPTHVYVGVPTTS